MTMIDDAQEKRRFFRISDTINLLFRRIDSEEARRHSLASDRILESCSLTTAMSILNREAALLAPRLERRDPEMFEYLKIIDNKINVLTQSLSSNDSDFSDNDRCEVNLSAAGIAFTHEQAIPVGTMLELKMLLTSSLVVIVAIARVVQCKAPPDKDSGVYTVCAEYENLREEDRELLVKHVMKKQMQQLRDKNTQ
ncbi:PilZ domain-containing protein [Methylomonas rhizoryzae]|uniref:PilZ domain-containing protein n=1 Tax=Methylomonas rhizoryzae TaxID=2608981 RepID=UPI001E60B232|nr:PilZ domain-containing protein [Methylomonas rhizoryzae]